ncbi:hypothetical protein [Pusillimonas sp.]|uniref:hypothetical protein n=1 Tax=Pusillimonas sp. TaxID=3040095 RepID=UPI0029BE4EBA|nr:hypothetical protein [Pusillimonas sp.]MDX3893462.1 hypothetical protein [Pusillimonas sp.]
MNMKALFIAPVTALLLGVSGAGVAATPSGDGTSTGMKAEPGMMHNGDASQMGQMNPGRMKDHGMMGMMGSCPMMGAASGANSKVMMQMHGEMMRAMGDIMIKYADKLEVPSSPQ